MPLPSDETTPPVTKMCLAMPASFRRGLAPGHETCASKPRAYATSQRLTSLRPQCFRHETSPNRNTPET